MTAITARRGDIVWCALEPDPRPGEAGYSRPVVVISSDRMSPSGPIVVVPLTTTPRAYPTVVELSDALPRPSYAQCEQIRAVSRSRIGATIATVDVVALARIEAVLRRVLQL